jgi:hypothetical protein
MDWDAPTCGVRRGTLVAYGLVFFVLAAILTGVIVGIYLALGGNQLVGSNRFV